jgi:hypothetical protein
MACTLDPEIAAAPAPMAGCAAPPVQAQAAPRGPTRGRSVQP